MLNYHSWLAWHAWERKERKREGGGGREQCRGEQGLTCLFHFVPVIQVTGAGAENGSPRRAPPVCLGGRHRCTGVCGVGAVCLRSLGLPRCIIHQNFNSIYLYTFAYVCAQCVCVCVCVCIMTVISYDRMITPFSPQLRGDSPLLSLHLPPEELCASTYVRACFLWAATLLCVSSSLLPLPSLHKSQEPLQCWTTKPTEIIHGRAYGAPDMTTLSHACPSGPL